MDENNIFKFNVLSEQVIYTGDIVTEVENQLQSLTQSIYGKYVKSELINNLNRVYGL